MAGGDCATECCADLCAATCLVGCLTGVETACAPACERCCCCCYGPNGFCCHRQPATAWRNQDTAPYYEATSPSAGGRAGPIVGRGGAIEIVPVKVQAPSTPEGHGLNPRTAAV